MAALGPFEARPALAAAVSGGADSMALALLARDWVQARDGSLLALVVDHGLRAESATEAHLVVNRLSALGISARVLPLAGLRHGPALAARARAARYASLTAACADAGILHLLLGHHATDQAETLMIRVLSGSGARGLAGMAAVQETRRLRLLRPMLGIDAPSLRAFLRAASVSWVEDPSNRDTKALRPRLRHQRPSDPGGAWALSQAASAAGHRRGCGDAAAAAVLAERVEMRPEGFAILSPGAIAPEVLAELLRVVAGAAFAPGLERVAGLAADLRPMTLWGARLLPAGRLGDGWLVVREAAGLAPPMAALESGLWDGRFRPCFMGAPPEGLMVGALGADAARFRRRAGLPSVVLATLPALRCGNILVAVPHLRYSAHSTLTEARMLFDPPRPMASAPFFPL